MSTHLPLDEAGLAAGVAALSDRDLHLAQIVQAYGPPPLWPRAPGFPTLVRIILEQQVSLASAQAAFDRLVTLASPLTPERFMALDDASLKNAGFSRQKMAYGRGLAQALLDGSLDLTALETMSDESVHEALIRVKGIGRWTVDVYLLMALRRPDAWPSGDLALATAVQRVKGMAVRPLPAELDHLGESWRPWRAVAARLFWHHYLSTPRAPR